MQRASSYRRRGDPRPRRAHPRQSWPAALLGALALALLVAPSALANSTRSSNWAGYAAHGSHVSFHRVFGAWRQPAATCTAGTPTYSSVWVGLGGYSPTSPALEQIGSEVDCPASGPVVSSVWYELVPAASRTIRMTVAPGDYLTAAVTVNGHDVRLQIDDVTRRTSFQRTVHVNQLDVSSAEWIVEAPSVCSGNASCQELALANFGSAQFSRANVIRTGGYHGRIVDRRWSTTKITLAANGRRFIANPAAAATASPSTLTAGGSAFTITYASSPGSGAPPAKGSAQTASVLARPHRS
ncbi:MAG: G1 family glutamic endopeptidase [Solirubrobacteraceae bacterium]